LLKEAIITFHFLPHSSSSLLTPPLSFFGEKQYNYSLFHVYTLPLYILSIASSILHHPSSIALLMLADNSKRSSCSIALCALIRKTVQLIALLSIYHSRNVQGFARPSCNIKKAAVHGTRNIRVLKSPMRESAFTATMNIMFYREERSKLRSSISFQDGDQPVDSVEEELNRLQNNLHAIEALEERNKAQIESFIDEADQWDSLEDYERELLQSKEAVVQRLNKMTEELLQMWMGAKSMDG
jgi:hypothetical protein